jgi:hypothetical protein
LLDGLDICTGSVYVDMRTAVAMLPIYGRQNLAKFSEAIGFNHAHKRKRLLTLLQES